MIKQNTLDTVDAVIDELGGSGPIMKMTGVKSVQAVFEWKKNGRIPSKFYCLMTDELDRLKYTASRKVWGMVNDQRAPSQ